MLNVACSCMCFLPSNNDAAAGHDGIEVRERRADDQERLFVLQSGLERSDLEDEQADGGPRGMHEH